MRLPAGQAWCEAYERGWSFRAWYTRPRSADRWARHGLRRTSVSHAPGRQPRGSGRHAGELAEPGIAVAVHPAAEAHQMRLRMLGIAVGREAVPRRRWRAAPPGPLVPDIGPDPSRRCLAGSRREYLDRGIVGEQGPASQHMAPDGVGQGYDAGKKIKGRKRHALVDNDGRGLVLEALSGEYPRPRWCPAAAVRLTGLVLRVHREGLQLADSGLAEREGERLHEPP